MKRKNVIVYFKQKLITVHYDNKIIIKIFRIFGLIIKEKTN